MNPIDDQEMRELTAYHEAGHAAMFLLARKKFTRVALSDGRDENLGAVHRRPDRALMGFCNVGDHAERHILILLAGATAVAVRGETRRPSRDAFIGHREGQADDYERATAYAGIVLMNSLPHPRTPRATTSEEIVGHLEGLAYETLKDAAVWAGVTALADALLEKGKLGYTEARRIFADAMKKDGSRG